MSDLTPLTALGGTEPQSHTIGTITIAENADNKLASVSLRHGNSIKLALPAVGKFKDTKVRRIIWTGPDQYFFEIAREDIAAHLAKTLGSAVAITEQTGGWVRLDVEGTDCIAMLERLCGADTAVMKTGDAVRTVIEHLGVFVLCQTPQTAFSIYGASSSAHSLFHALETAAKSVTP